MAPHPSSRPLSPHLSIYQLSFTMAMSIAHRLCGLALIAALPLLIWWLTAAAAGPEAYALIQNFYASVIGKALLFAYSWILLHHMIGGIRHLIADTGLMLDYQTASLAARMTLILSFSMTFILWSLFLILC